MFSLMCYVFRRKMHRSGGVAQSVYVDTISCSTVGFDRLVESQEGLDTEVGSRADLISLERSGVPRATEVLGQEFLDQISPEGHRIIPVWCVIKNWWRLNQNSIVLIAQKIINGESQCLKFVAA
ncbi:hypothetical protein M9H77_11630 [Catharanthus roseus]|uniref:Uncharacterized protein n=1 Tax=Catharanthus roseus TaxID=4058 RepID=A0ACC0BF29_CATRO|nr:hypothetical protein M9H77_11630 [Catharanthus roseus]